MPDGDVTATQFLVEEIDGLILLRMSEEYSSGVPGLYLW